MKLPDEVLNDIPSDDEDGEKSTEPQQFAGIHTEFQSDDDEGNDETDSGFDSSLSGYEVLLHFFKMINPD